MLSILSVLLVPYRDSDTDHKNKTRLLRTKERPGRRKKLCERPYLGKMMLKWGAQIPGLFIGLAAGTDIKAIPRSVGIEYEAFRERLEGGRKAIRESLVAGLGL